MPRLGGIQYAATRMMVESFETSQLRLYRPAAILMFYCPAVIRAVFPRARPSSARIVPALECLSCSIRATIQLASSGQRVGRPAGGHERTGRLRQRHPTLLEAQPGVTRVRPPRRKLSHARAVDVSARQNVSRQQEMPNNSRNRFFLRMS
jgi:hypothetical protein